jgi:hypothetical protein
MYPFVIRTAIPFGYLLAYGFLVGLVVVGIGLFATGIRRRTAKLAVVGALALGCAGYVVAVNIAEDDALDMNPSYGGGAALAGRWVGNDRTTLVLAPNGTYRCTGKGECLALTHPQGPGKRSAVRTKSSSGHHRPVPRRSSTVSSHTAVVSASRI